MKRSFGYGEVTELDYQYNRLWNGYRQNKRQYES